MKKTIVFIALFTMGCGFKSVKTAEELARYQDCDPGAIGSWIDAKIAFNKTGHVWHTSEQCLTAEKGDCKCAATIAKDALNSCGYESKIVILESADKKERHAIATYIDPQGRRGFINWYQHDRFAPGTDWSEIIAAVKGGPWREHGRPRP